MSTFTNESSKAGHFIDGSGIALPELEPIYGLLLKYFGKSVPERIIVKAHIEDTSQFRFPAMVVLISSSAKNRYRTVGHESAHLALAAFTNGISTHNEFRFFDEGFAKIFDAEICSDRTNYKDQALRTARRKQQSDGISFAKIQNWANYFGNPSLNKGNPNWCAYEVGASFNFFVIDVYGLGSLLSFFQAVGITKNLNHALLITLKKDQETIEQEWQSWLATTN